MAGTDWCDARNYHLCIDSSVVDSPNCVKMIVFNEFLGSPFKSPPQKDVEAFQQTLIDNHYTTMLRKSKGNDILAACGQLSGSFGR